MRGFCSRNAYGLVKNRKIWVIGVRKSKEDEGNGQRVRFRFLRYVGWGRDDLDFYDKCNINLLEDFKQKGDMFCYIFFKRLFGCFGGKEFRQERLDVERLI